MHSLSFEEWLETIPSDLKPPAMEQVLIRAYDNFVKSRREVSTPKQKLKDTLRAEQYVRDQTNIFLHNHER